MDDKTAGAFKGVLKRLLERRAEFNDKVTGVPIPAEPTLLSAARHAFFQDFLDEEHAEIFQGYTSGDIDRVADGYIDLMVVSAGALVEMGLAVQPLLDEVLDANMRKRRGTKATRPGSQGFDAVKPEGWVGPDFADYLTVTKSDVDALVAAKQGKPDWIVFGGAHRYEKAKGIPVHAVGDPQPQIVHLRPTQLTDSRLTELFSGMQANPFPPKKPKVLVLGYARHGKDTAAEIIAGKYGLNHTSSSAFLTEHVIIPAFRAIGHEYASADECYADRVNHRAFWFDAISAFNKEGHETAAALYEDHDIYVGLRNAREFHAVRNEGLYDVCIWVDASGRGLPPEGRDSCTVEPWMADFVVDNSGTLEDLERNLSVVMDRVMEDL